MNLKQQRAAVIAAAQSIISGVKSAGRPLTDSERATLAEKRAEVDRLSALIVKADADAELFASFNSGWKSGTASAAGTGKALSFKGMADRLLRPEDGGVRNIKALLAEGEQTLPTSDIELTVLKDRPSLSAMEAIPAEEVPEHFSYLRQTVRTNNAAPVAVGALKPTSIFTLSRIEERLKVIAHLSEPIPEYWLKDSPALTQFIENEMLSGLAETVVAQFLNGTGVGEDLNGITLASGIQTQAFSNDAVETARVGLGKLEVLGMDGALLLLNPSDWVAIETTREDGTTGGFLLGDSGAPVDRVRRQLWGVPVALTTGVTAGTGYAVATDAVRLFHDGTVSLKWGVIGDDFGRNQIRCRAEGRFEAGTLRPSGVVEMTLAAAG